MGQNEEAIAQVARANFSRRLDARSNDIAQALKVADDVLQAKGEMVGDVFKEAPFWRDILDDAGDIRPEVSGIVCALS